MAINKQTRHAQNIRRNEVSQHSAIHRDNSLGINIVDFKDFCGQLTTHASEGKQFIDALSHQTAHTRSVSEAYATLAEKASRLQRATPSTEVDQPLRLLLIRDLLAVTEQEKNIHLQTVPVNHGKRAIQTAALIGGGLLAGYGIGVLGDLIGDLGDIGYNATHIASSTAEYPSHGVVDEIRKTISENQIPSQLKLEGLANVFLDINRVHSHAGIVQVGLNENTFAALGGLAGATAATSNIVKGLYSDIDYGKNLQQVPPASTIDQQLMEQGQSEGFKQALALYHNIPLVAKAQAENNSQKIDIAKN